jgi:predicted transcriptional regulator
MTLTLTPDTETRLRVFAEEQGLAPEQVHDALLTHALEEAEAELQDTLAGLDQSMADVAAGRWITAEEMHQRLSKRVAELRTTQKTIQK